MTAILILICLPGISAIGELSKETHKTAGASQQKNELACYVCDSLDDHRCLNLNQTEPKQFLKKCNNQQRVCKVKKYSYTIGTENTTSLMRVWSMQRECTHKCESGCIVIGERTKLYSCTTCCSKTACNKGSGGEQLVATATALMPLLVLALFSTRL